MEARVSDTLKVLRFADLKAAGIVTNWPQLRRLVDNHGFPRGYLLTPGCRVWDVEAVEGWKQSRREAAERAATATEAA
jgi:hypothetical protein